MSTPRHAPQEVADPLGPPLLLTVAQAAYMASLGTTTIEVLVASGQLASLKVGRARRIPREALERFIADRLDGVA